MEAVRPKKKRPKHRSARRERDAATVASEDVLTENTTDDDVALKENLNESRGEKHHEREREEKTEYYDSPKIQINESVLDKENIVPQVQNDALPMEYDDTSSAVDVKPDPELAVNECHHSVLDTRDKHVVSEKEHVSMEYKNEDIVMQNESPTSMDLNVSVSESSDVHSTTRDSILSESMDVSGLYPDIPKESSDHNLSITDQLRVSCHSSDIPSIYPKLQNVDVNVKPIDWNDVLRGNNSVIPNAPPENLIDEHKSLDLIDLSTEIPGSDQRVSKKTDTLKKTIRWQSVSDNEDTVTQSSSKRRISRNTIQWLLTENNENDSKTTYRTYQQSSGYTSDAEIVDPSSYLVRQNSGMIVLELKTLCEIHLLDTIRFGNCLQLLQAANSYDSFILLSEALKVAARNFNEVWKTEAFLNLNKHDLLRLFCHPKIKGHREVVSALLYWYNHERDARTASYKMLLEELQILEVEKEDEIILKPKIKKEKKDSFAVLFSPYIDNKLKAYILDVHNCEKSPVTLSKPPDMGADYAVCLSRFCCSDYFFITGGHGKDGGKKMWMYDIYHSKWKKCKSMPKERTNHTMASVSPRVYVIGGYQSGTATANIDCFSMKSNRWKTVGKLKVPVADATCVVRRGIIYVFGGVSTEGLGLSVVQSFNVETGETTQLPDLPFVCVKGRAESVKGRIYIAIETGPILRYNPETNKAQIHVKSPMKRRHFAMIPDGDELIFIGGHSYESGPLRTVEKYCPSTDNWTYLGKLKTGLMSVAAVCLHYRLS